MNISEGNTKKSVSKGVLGAATILFGLLYIPAFIYGYFWLWVFPFTGIVVLFTRAMIEQAIEQVSKVGDEAVQAKAMIPQFIKMNVVMTVLLSIPFVSALWLSAFGYIDRLQYSDTDRSFFEYFIGIFAKEWMEPEMFKSIAANDPVYILTSNLFMAFVIFTALLAFCWKPMKRMFQILLHKESYKYLQKRVSMGSIVHIWHWFVFLLFFVLFGLSGYAFENSYSVSWLSFLVLFSCFQSVLMATNIVWGFVDESIIFKN